MKDTFLEIFREAIELEDDFSIKLEDEFRDYDNWDSLTQLSLIAAIDETFDLVIEEDDFKSLLSVQALLDYIENNKR